MVNINSSSSVKDNSHVEPPKTASTTATTGPISSESEVKPRSAAATVSPFAQQLSDAAERATVRDSTLNIGELAKIAQSILEKIAGMSYVNKKERHDAEIPKTDDTVLLARAKQATAFVSGKGVNPFAGMSREQLALITYDEGGPFTVNERYAAFHESCIQEELWRQAIAAKAQDAYRRTGSANGGEVALEILEHYRNLPLIEQSQYPRDYEAQLLRLAAQSSDHQDPTNWITLLDKWEKAQPSDGIVSKSVAFDKVLPVPANGDISEAVLQARIEENKRIVDGANNSAIEPAAREDIKNNEPGTKPSL